MTKRINNCEKKECEQIEIIAKMEEQLIQNKETHLKLNGALDKIWIELKEIREIVTGRPSWTVTTIFTLLTLAIGWLWGNI